MKKETPDNDSVEVRIYSIATSLTESIIFLDETAGTRILPIWIGPVEAQAIAIRLSGYPSPRPMTHDLIFSFLKTTGFKIDRVTISDITDNTYYSSIFISDKTGKTQYEIDSRPSDALALSVRSGCPIFINEAVFRKTQVLSKPITEDEVLKFKQELKTLKPTDIISQLLNGKFPPAANPGDEQDKEDDDSGEKQDEQT